MSPKKPRIAWFASSKPDSLSEFVTSQYLPYLQNEFTITRFVGDDQVGVAQGTFYQQHRTAPFDSFVYCLERDKSSDFAWANLGVEPGVVLLLEDFAPAEKPWLFQSAYQETLSILDGEKNTPLDLADREPYPVDAEIRAAMLASKIILSSEEMLERIPEQFRTKCAVIPFPISMKEVNSSHTERFEIAVATPVSEDYMASKILQAVNALPFSVQLSWHVESEAEDCELMRLKEIMAIPDKVVIKTFRRSFDSWQANVKHASVALHLQSWGRASLEPYLGISLSSGIPVVTTNFGVGRLLSDELVIKVSIGLSSAHQILSALVALREEPWDAKSQQQKAGSRYATAQNAAELGYAISQEIQQCISVRHRLLLARTATRAAWKKHITELLSDFNYGKSLAPGTEFLDSL